MLWGAEEVLRTSISTFQRVRRTRSPSGCWSRRRGRCGRCVCLQTGAASCAWLIRVLASDSVAPSHSPPAPYAPLLPCVRTHSRARAHTHTHTHTHTKHVRIKCLHMQKHTYALHGNTDVAWQRTKARYILCFKKTQQDRDINSAMTILEEQLLHHMC